MHRHIDTLKPAICEAESAYVFEATPVVVTPKDPVAVNV
jgi:hypothetical protein